jgi:thioredoxin reductase (NADPH)
MEERDLIVVGGGLAGLTAAAEAARLGLRCAAFTGPTPGGLLLSIESVQGLPGHPGGIPGYDLCPMAQEAGMDAGAEFIADDATALRRDADAWVVTAATRTLHARAVVLAPGARLRTLGVAGEQAYAGKGVSHCASCDGPLLRGRPVAVVGGGDAACQEALSLAAHASVVHLLVRGARLRAREGWQRRLRDTPRIEVRLQTRVEAIEGGTAVEALRLHDGSRLAVDAVFVYAGLEPATAWLRGAVELDADGGIAVDATLRGAAPGLYGAGCARRGNGGQAADAIADGLAAARAAQQDLG